MRRVVVIPARLESKRLSNKLILDLKGKTIIERVYDKCKKVDGAEVYIATDSSKIERVCKNFTDNIILTKKTHKSGTDRIAEAVSLLNCESVINVQGDEPFIDPKLINNLFELLEEDKEINMVSAMEKINKLDDFKDPNVVKVITDYNNNAIYFSRSPIPFCLSNEDNCLNEEVFLKHKLYKHIGIYGYKKAFLLKYTEMEESSLELIENLEQLRAVENGYKIKMMETTSKSLGIDTIEDYTKALNLIENGFK